MQLLLHFLLDYVAHLSFLLYFFKKITYVLYAYSAHFHTPYFPYVAMSML